MCIWLSEHLSTYHLSLACAGSKGEAVRAHSSERCAQARQVSCLAQGRHMKRKTFTVMGNFVSLIHQNPNVFRGNYNKSKQAAVPAG